MVKGCAKSDAPINKTTKPTIEAGVSPAEICLLDRISMQSEQLLLRNSRKKSYTSNSTNNTSRSVKIWKMEFTGHNI